VLIVMLGFVFVMLGFNVWSSVQKPKWLEKNDHDEIISRRPMAERAQFGLFTMFLVWLGYLLASQPRFQSVDPALWGAAAFFIATFGSLTLCFLNGAGPRRLCFDIRQQQYSFTQGFPLLTWTKWGPTAGGEIYVFPTKSGYHQIRFQAQGWKGGLPIESFKTEQQARSQAGEIADRLGLTVRRKGAATSTQIRL